MTSDVRKQSSLTAAFVFDLLDPVPFGFFIGALIFDAIYTNSANVMWLKAAAWLITFGLIGAVVPRFINLFRVWWPGVRSESSHARLSFFLYLFGVIAAIVNAFVHSRDAYAAIPEGLWLSALTVTFLVLSKITETLQHSTKIHQGQS